MSSVSSPAALPQFISQLLAERQQHVADIQVIDATLTRVTAALGTSTTAKAAMPAMETKPMPVAKKRPGRPPKKPAATVAAKPAAPAAKKSGRTGLTAHEFVLGFVKGSKNATTQDINKHWKASGRLGNADNTMSQLTKLKKLKRSPLASGLRGSQYAAT